MAKTVVMPQLGNSVESCLIVSWEVSEGDTVDVNTVLCEVETDKSSMDIPSPEAGTVLKLLWSVGDDVPVKDPLVIIGEPGEKIDDAPAAPQPAPITASTTAAPSRTAPTSATSPRARHLAAREHIDIATVGTGSGPHGRIIARDVQAAADAAPRTAAAARSGATAAGLGTGLGGRISTADLAPSSAPTSTIPQPTGDYPGPSTTTTLTGIRKIVAQRMMESLTTSAQLTYTASAKAHRLLAMRNRLKATDDSLGLNKITVGDLVGFAVVRTLLRHPYHNAHLVDQELTTFDRVHLGIAVDTPRGLLVPTIRNADAMTVRAFCDASKALAAEAASGKISPGLLSGATFTVSNLGSFGIESFTPIINRPQTAILGVNTVVARVTTTDDGEFGVEQRIGFSLTADHQVIDGADAARFLHDLVTTIEAIDVAVLG